MLAGSYHNGFAPRDGVPMYPELWRGCVGAWTPCLGPTGLTLYDWAFQKRHGTLTNMDAGTDWAPDSGRYALDFNGSTDLVSIPQNSFASLIALTCVFWMKTTDASAGRGIVTGFDNNTGATGWGFDTMSGRIRVALSPVDFFRTLNTVVNDNTWRCIALTVGGGTASAFVNGRLDLSWSHVFPVAPTYFQLGRNNAAVSFAGRLDDVRVYSRVLTQNEITLLASRRGIAYDLAPRRRGGVFTAGGFKAYWAARKAAILGGGLQ